MRRRRVVTLLLSLLAALLWAPLSASAAPSNTLLSPLVSPPRGDTSTLFVFSVRYRSTAGTVAVAVSVTVAGRAIGMSLTAGTGSDGTWSGSGRLPSGTWSTVFTATPAKGPKPSLTGPAVSVSPSPTPTPQPSGSVGLGASDLPEESTGPSANPSPVSIPSATVTGSPSAAPAAGDDAPGSSPAATAGDPGPGWTPGTIPPGSDGGTTARATRAPGLDRGGGGAARSSPVPRPSASDDLTRVGSGRPVATGGSGDAGRQSHPDVQQYVALALAAAALACLVLLFAWRSRNDDRPAPAAQAAIPASSAASPGRPEEAAPDLVIPRRRVTARQRIPADDPILAAMGLDARTPGAAAPAADLTKRRPARPARRPGGDAPPGAGADHGTKTS